MIEWDKNNLPGINFSCIDPLPPTDFLPESFDLIFGISIFTDLSKESHFLWINELHRVLKQNSVLLFTTHGSYYKNKLTNHELKEYNAGNILEQKYAKEGLRVYCSFHPRQFIHKLIKGKFEILSYYNASEFPDLIGSQDKWVLRKI